MFRNFLNNLTKVKGATYTWQSGESIRDIHFPFDISKAKNISFSAVTISSDDGRVPYFQMHEIDGKLRIIPVINGSMLTIQKNLAVNVIFIYQEIN